MKSTHKLSEKAPVTQCFESIPGSKHTVRGVSYVRNTTITADGGSFSAYPPLVENTSGEKVGSPTVSAAKDSTDPLTPAVVGKKIVVFNLHENGLITVSSRREISAKPKMASLRDIWRPGEESNYTLFIDDLEGNGVISKNMQWLHGSVSVIHCYRFLSEKGMVMPGLPWTDVYKAFTGTFHLVKVKHARSLRDRGNKTVAYFKNERKWKDFFYSRFFFRV